MRDLPLKPIKHILQKYYEGEISNETVIFLRDILIHITEYLAQETTKEFQKQNQIRQFQGLSPLKRLDKTSIKIVGERILNQINDKNIADEVGEYNKTLLCQDGAKSNG